MSSHAHFTGVYILQRGCLLCLFFSMAVEGPEDEQAVVKHPRFFYVVIEVRIVSDLSAWRTE